MERLEALRDLKLKLQMFAVGSIITIFAELFSVKLTDLVETTKEEGKEKTSAKEKEATKEVHEIEIKLDAEGRYQIVVPSYLLDFSSGVAKPITLTKQELDLLSASLKNLMRPVHKDDVNKGNSVVPKQEVNEKQGQENKKATQPAPKPVAARPTKEPGKVPGASGIKFCFTSYGESASFEERRPSANVDGRRTTPLTNEQGDKFSNKKKNKSASYAEGDLNGSVNKEGIESTNKRKTDNPYAKLAAKAAERNARKKCAEAPTKHDYPIDHFQVPSETNGKSHASDRNEPQQSSMNNAQPTGECRDVKVNNHVESIGKTQEVSLRGR
ncbi:MAG: hypothetical protein PG978_000654 [Wolbachia endosymbiont of Ctenocephalides felis wCfeF]|nr:MAG: hypothetical protein PG978_000654 [Wolbachia endosymbiont of Ctenocephalides felis wCfeF]